MLKVHRPSEEPRFQRYQLILHASSKAMNDRMRRVLHIEYAATLDLDGRARLAT